MAREYVNVTCNVYCRYEGLPPIYRLYLNDELFAERTWRWDEDFYLVEELQVEAEPGDYAIRYELVPPTLAELIIGIPVVRRGNGRIIDNGILRIENAPA